MSAAIPQRLITISLKLREKGMKAYYTYVSPVSGASYQDAPTCDLTVDQPTYCLFVLDFSTTASGWTIQNICADKSSPGMAFVRGPNNLSILTDDPAFPDTVYKFSICYWNPVTKEKYCEDPQEGNGPPPRDDE